MGKLGGEALAGWNKGQMEWWKVGMKACWKDGVVME